MVGTRQFDENDFLDTAVHVFTRQGYQSTTMVNLACESGIQRGSLYNAYGDKETIFIKAYRRYAEDFAQQVEQALSESDLRRALRGFFELCITNMHCGEAASGCFTTRMLMEAAAHSEVIAEEVRVLMDSLESLFRKRLERARRQGVFLGNSAKWAQFLVSLSRGMAVVERVYRDESRLRSIYRVALDSLPVQ